MAKTIRHDLLILGSGLAGLRAALEASIVTGGKIDIGLISKVQLMRSHSVAAEGGTAAILRTEEGDSLELHAWDTVKGSDFLADQDVVFRFVEAMPAEIQLLDKWGIPWSRRPDGRIAMRPFGGHSFPRAVYAADKTGFFEMQTLYDTLLKYQNFTRYDESFVTSIQTAGRPVRRRDRHRDGHRRVHLLRRQGADHLHRRHRPDVRLHHVRPHRDGRRHGPGLQGRPAAQGHGIPAVPPHRADPLGHPDDRGLPRGGRIPGQQRRGAVHEQVRPGEDGAGAPRSRSPAPR